MEKFHRAKPRNYMRCNLKEVDNSDEKLQMRAVERKIGWSPSFPHCQFNLQCLKKKKKKKKRPKQKILTFPHNELLEA